MASLEVLEKSPGQRMPFECEMSMLEMYRGLVVMRRQGWIPVSVLRGLWNLQDASQAMDVIGEFVLASLAQREDRVTNGTRVAGITLHDLHLDFVKGQTRDGDLEKWHRKVLCIWLRKEEGSSVGGGLGGRRDWCAEEIFGDEYVRNNVCRHLFGGELRDELYELLRNPQWAAKKLCVGEAVPLEADIRMLVEYMERREGKGTEAGGVIWSLNMIGGAARLSAPYVSRNESEIWFQLYGRLFRYGGRSEVLQTYIAEIEGCAKGPWLKMVMGYLHEPGGALQSTTLCEGKVYCLSEIDEAGKFSVCGKSIVERVFVSTFVKGQEEKTVWLSNGHTSVHENVDGNDVVSDGAAGSSASRIALPSLARSSFVTSICCTGDGSYVAIGHYDGSVQIWDAKMGKVVGDAPVRHSDEVYYLAWSPDGKRIASGGRDGVVHVWDVEKGEAVLEALVKHSRWVLCVAWSPIGKQIASGGDNGTVRLWDVEKGEVVGEVLVGHSRLVLCIAFSPDGKLIASGGSDGTVRLWDVENGEVVGEALVGHRRWVICVA